jgi:hypothetical protein
MAKLQRPDIYVPLSVRFHTGRTGTALRKRFGRDGAFVWACYLTACKLNQPAGEISYASEAEGWARLGLDDDPPDFTLSDFFAATGKLRKTKKQRSGKVTYVICTVWERWTKAQKQEAERERKARIRAKSKRDIKRTRSGQGVGHRADKPRTASGHERDLETEELRKPSRGESASPNGGSFLDENVSGVRTVVNVGARADFGPEVDTTEEDDDIPF